jgi:hypothetical protein
MAYIGNTPAEAFSAFQKQDFTTSATTSYTLDHPVSNQNEIALFINFVRQEPTAAYTASGTTLTLTSATTSSDDMYCVYLGKAVQTVNPPNSSVGSSQVSADLITGQTALGATPADTDELLISDAGTLKRVDFSHIKAGTNTPYFQAYRNAALTITSGTWTKITFDTEDFDTANGFDTSTGKYTIQSGQAGKYLIGYSIRSSANGNSNSIRIFSYGEKIDTGGTSVNFGNASLDFRNNYGEGGSLDGSAILNCAVGDAIQVNLYHQTVSGNVVVTEGSYRPTYIYGYKIIE